MPAIAPLRRSRRPAPSTLRLAAVAFLVLAPAPTLVATSSSDQPTKLADAAVVGPRLVLDLSDPDAEGDTGRRFVALGEVALFARVFPQGNQLWRTDGTTAGTYALLDASWTVPPELDQQFLLVAGGRAYFIALELPGYVAGLWITDGTVPGTRLLREDFWPETSSGAFSEALGLTVFTDYDFDAGVASIWSSDGTVAGTGPLPGFEALPPDLGFPQVLADGDAILLAFDDPRTSTQTLWRVDGDAASPTVSALRSDFPSAPRAFFPTPLGVHYFVHAGDRDELWRTDGTAAGTVRVVALPPGAFSFGIGALQGGFAFGYTSDAHGPQVWVSDGTGAGTRRATSIPVPPPGRSSFQARRGADAVYVFVINQTTRVADQMLAIPSVTSAPVELPVCAGIGFCVISPFLFELDGKSLFQADDGQTGLELWRTDGTPAGTARVLDYCPGSCSSHLFPYAAIGATTLYTTEPGDGTIQLLARTGNGELEPIPELEPYRIQGFFPKALLGTTLVYRAFDLQEGAALLALDVEPTECVASGTTLCLGDGRFALSVSWRDFTGRTGVGRAAPLTADTGTFWFFDPANLELIVKVLDGRAVNGFFWVFYGALSNVEYDLTVTDTESGESRTYHNPAGTFASNGDTEALPGEGGSSWRASRFDAAALAGKRAAPPALGEARSRAPAATAPCVPDDTTLCLGDGRFALTVDWTVFNGGTGSGRTRPLTADTGSFWFFNRDNIELVIKVLDARGVNGRFWVFYGALSNVAYTITVTDTETGASKTYRNELGAFGSVGDTEAF